MLRVCDKDAAVMHLTLINRERLLLIDLTARWINSYAGQHDNNFRMQIASDEMLTSRKCSGYVFYKARTNELFVWRVNFTRNNNVTTYVKQSGDQNVPCSSLCIGFHFIPCQTTTTTKTKAKVAYNGHNCLFTIGIYSINGFQLCYLFTFGTHRRTQYEHLSNARMRLNVRFADRSGWVSLEPSAIIGAEQTTCKRMSQGMVLKVWSS